MHPIKVLSSQLIYSVASSKKKENMVKNPLIAFLCVTLIFGGCASYEKQPYPQMRPEEVPYVSEIPDMGLKVGVRPLITKEDQDVFFEENLRRAGILPVLLTIDNSTRKAFTINTSDIQLISPDEKIATKVPFERVYKKFKKTYLARVFGSFVAGTALAIASFLILTPMIIILPILSLFNVKSVNEEVEQDLQRRTIFTHMSIHPSTLKQGFIFFDLDKNESISGYKLEINNIRSTSGKTPQTVELSFAFN